MEGLGVRDHDPVGASASALCRPLVAPSSARAPSLGQFSVHVCGCKLSANSAPRALPLRPRGSGTNQRHGPAPEGLLDGWCFVENGGQEAGGTKVQLLLGLAER